MELSDRDREVLEFARLSWRYVGAQGSAVRERFGWSLTRITRCSTRCSTGRRPRLVWNMVNA